ncbi:3-hydroxyisobutyrate dehydrogenase [Rubellimicrobium thermophilum DSM 16684]|uniref:3-hydroxyisobutyrate dehydrogenase n=1 Tax=Rubellimicrobium thermophilum DSM 16684 TaxID=1123069 RepID=S9SBE7_9RHOB|nr:NAD(P)-dependent oxidoreductase [Rubellimicrobium thermophilum]EPX87450.1 3-hydroxyisobutyrate dehydrogenase [Rubellimicrobium thermophilum DSM 16684]
MNRVRGPLLAMIGFGEAGRAFAAGFGSVAAHDIRPMPDCHLSPGPALAGAEVVFCLVTADQALAAAEACAPHLEPGALWLDGNSCAPGTKLRAAAVIEAAGGRYVDLAIMAPVHPRGHRTPCLIAGPHSADALALCTALGMDVRVAGDRIGAASMVKMLRSVIVKGIEALCAESLLAARRAGVEEAVLASLQDSDPGFDWRARASYSLERMMAHGARRAAEMREVAATLRELGLPDAMAAATARWQDRIAALALEAGEDDLARRIDRILGSLP